MNSPETPKSAHPAGNQNTAKGMAYISVTALTGAFANAIIRHLSFSMHPFEIVFFRSFFGVVVFLTLMLNQRFITLKANRPWLLCFRGFLQVIQLTFVVLSIKLTPLAKVAALRFTGPLFATVLTLIFLGERFRMRRAVALAIGFLGALVVLRPGLIETDLGAIFALSAAATWACVQMTVKVLGRTESSVTITIYSTLFATPCALLIAYPYLTMPTLQEFGWVALVGALGSVAHICRAQAFKEADLTAVMPMEFSKLIWVSILGFAFFGEVPEIWTWLGGFMIFSGSGYIALRERQLKRWDKGPSVPIASE
jgi:drug/metabolite transporter (DMT)-like permease